VIRWPRDDHRTRVLGASSEQLCSGNEKSRWKGADSVSSSTIDREFSLLRGRGLVLPKSPSQMRGFGKGSIEMAEPQKIAFDAPAFLAKAGLGRRIIQLKPKQAFFSQGGPADSIFRAVAPN
jgi:hypothetical protein